MGKALYRKYRSKSLDDVVGQDHIVKTLQNALKQGHISHAYLFTGPHGVGKTSVARIMAHEFNKLPYVEDDNNIDIIEIDAASNRRIDEIRDLRDKVYIAPAKAAYKVYIIDEVHMLTKEAFNALLKTLEEPPSHVIFILATTESHKLPQTIVSRTQRYSFKPANVSLIERLLGDIAKKEKIKISKEAIQLISEHASGSYRDAVSLLDQASSISESVSADEVLQLLGMPSSKEIDKLVDMLVKRSDPQDLLTLLDNLYQHGFQAANISKQLAKRLRYELSSKRPAMSTEAILELLSKLIEVPASFNPNQKLEVCLLQAIPMTQSDVAQRVAPVVNEDLYPTEIEPVSVMPPDKELEMTSVQPEIIPDTNELNEPAAVESTNNVLWQQVLTDMKVKYNTLYGIVRMARPEFLTNNTVVLTFNFEFHKKRLEEARNRKILDELLQKHAGRKIEISFALDNSKAKPASATMQAEAKADINDSFITISNIFGGGELLES